MAFCFAELRDENAKFYRMRCKNVSFRSVDAEKSGEMDRG